MSNNNNGVLPNEITTIRDILVGPQMQDLAKRLDNLEQLFQEGTKQRGDMQKIEETKRQELLNTFNTRITEAEQTWKDKIADIEKKIEELRDVDKAEMGSLLIEMGKKLMKESV